MKGIANKQRIICPANIKGGISWIIISLVSILTAYVFFEKRNGFASLQPLASEADSEILRKGGNASMRAIATAAALTVESRRLMELVEMLLQPSG